MKQVRLLCTVLIFIAVSLDPILLKAQTPVNSPLKKFEMEIQDFQQQIGVWERHAYIQITLVVVIGVVGILITAFRKSDEKWTKAPIMFLGIVTSTCTLISTLVFSADYRSFQYAASEGQGIVRKLTNIVANYELAQPNAEDLKVFTSEFAKNVDAFNQISKSLEGNGSAQSVRAGSQVVLTLGLPLVYAQSSSPAPAWITKLPSDDRSFYFLGTASDASLSGAKTNSLNDAINKASSALMPGEPYSAERSGITSIKDAASIQDTFFSYDKNSATYSYYTLLRLSREIQDIRPTMTVYQQKHWGPVDLTFHPAAGLFVLDYDGAVSRVRIDRQGIHLETLFQLKRVDRPAELTANSEFLFTSSNNSIGCTVYKFSLASRKTSQRLILVGGGGCDGIAADGNTVYLVLPGKKEIRYWSNWDSSSPKSWSFNQIDRGGVLTFDSSGRRLLYANESGTAYAISVPEGKIRPLVSNVGVVHSIATDPNHVLLASGKKVLFYSRSDNLGENPPSNMQSLSGGQISGIAVDTTNSAWIADFDNGLIQGPFPRN
ncbi:MAG: hypothetical protein LAN36_14975 [Acidobacteriia bacterium]|nr:hypothetical protein [Terriglobia bacterium]